MNFTPTGLLMLPRTQLTNKTAQTLQVYSCELFIDSFKITYKGFVYFLWASENTQIQSLKYQSVGKLVPVKETLTIGVRVSSKNGKQQPFITFLKIITEEGEELDQFQLRINSLRSQFQEIEVPLDCGLCILKMRRIQLNIPQQQDQKFQLLTHYRSTKNNEIKALEGNEFELMQQQLLRVKKHLQDQAYLNNKLKNDRDVLLATKQELEFQTEQLLLQITKEVCGLRQHYANRFTIRDQCYEEEIQNLLNQFNAQIEKNREIIEILFKQKNIVQEQVKVINQKYKKIQLQILQRNEKIYQKENRINELNVKIEEYKASIETVINQKQEQLTQINLLRSQLETLNFNFQQKCKEYQQFIRGRQDLINQLKNEIQNGKERQGSNVHQLSQLQSQNNNLVSQLQNLRAKIQECEYELEFNENTIEQLKKQHSQRENELCTQLENTQQMYLKKIDELYDSFQFQKQTQYNNNELLIKQKQELQKKIAYLSKQSQQSDIQIYRLRKQIQELQKNIISNIDNANTKNQLIAAKQKEVESLRSQIEKLTVKAEQGEKLRIYQKKISEVQALLGKTKLQLQQKIRVLVQFQGQLFEKQQGGQSENRNQRKIFEQYIQSNNNQKLQLQKVIKEKQEIIQDLNSRVSQLEEIEEQLTNKLNQFFYKYPNINFQESLEQSYHVDVLQNDVQEQKYIIRKSSSRRSMRDIIDDDTKKNTQFQNILYVQNPDEKRLTCSNQVLSTEEKQMKQEIILEKKISIQKVDSFKKLPSQQKIPSQKKVPSQKKIIQIQKVPSLKKLPSENKIDDSRSKQLTPLSSTKVIVKMGDIPRSPKLKRQQSSLKSLRNDQSMLSGVKSVFHLTTSKKVRQLEEKALQFEKQQKIYLKQIQSYQEQIRQLKQQLQNLKKQKIIENVTNNDTGQFILRPLNSLKKVNTQSQVFMEDYRIKNLLNQVQLLQIEIQKKNLKINDIQYDFKDMNKASNLKQKQLKEINSQLTKIKEENNREIKIFNQKIVQHQKRQDQVNRKIITLTEQNKNLQKQIRELEDKARRNRNQASELQQKLSKQKHILQEAKIQIKQLTIHYETAIAEIRRLNNQKQTLLQKMHKSQGNQETIKGLKKQVQNLDKNIGELNRVMNQMKLQKDADEEQIKKLKNKQNEQTKAISEYEQKVVSLQRVIQEFKRKQSKLKKQLQEAQEEVRRAKNQQKRLQEEVQGSNTVQVGWHLQKRKYLEQINTLKDHISKKDYEINKLNKQMDKLKFNFQDRLDLKMGKKSESKHEIEKLQTQMLKKQKRLFEQIQQNKLLRSRLELVQRQNKKIVEKKIQSYGEKLKYYIEETENIKKLLDQYQNDNSRLKAQNNAIRQKFQMLKMNQVEYAKRQQDILNDLQGHIAQQNMLKQKLSMLNGEMARYESAYDRIKNDNNELTTQLTNTSEKLSVSQKNVQRLMAQLVQLKERLFQNQKQINTINEKCKILQIEKAQIEHQFRQLKKDLQNVARIYTFKKEDLENAIVQAKKQQRKQKQKQFSLLREQHEKAMASKTQQFQQTILKTYNQNDKFKAQIKLLIQQSDKEKGKLYQLELQRKKIIILKQENENLKEEIKKKIEQMSLMATSLEAQTNQKYLKQKQINETKALLKKLSQKATNLAQQIEQRLISQSQIKQVLIKVTQRLQKEKGSTELRFYKKESQIVKQLQQIVNDYQSIIANLKGEIQKLRQKQSKVNEQNATKMKKIYSNVQQMEKVIREKQKEKCLQYKNEIKELQHNLLKLSQELEQKMMRNRELSEAIILLQNQKKSLLKFLQQIKYVQKQEKGQYQNQLYKLHHKMIQSEKAYSKNIKILQQELMKAATPSKSRIRTKAMDGQERFSKLYEEKLKNKDDKIQQLKNNIQKMQHNMLAFKKKQAILESNVRQSQKLKFTIAQLQKESKKLRQQFETEQTKHTQLTKQLRKQILKAREESQKAKVALQQKKVQYQNVVCELSSIKKLYSQIQKQIQRRKNNISLQIEEENHWQNKLRLQETHKAELQERINEQIDKSNQLQNQLKIKNNQIVELRKNMLQLQIDNKNKQKELLKLTNEIKTFQRSLNETNTIYERTRNELRYCNSQNKRLRKAQQDLRTSCSSHLQQSQILKKEHQQFVKAHRQCQKIAQKYLLLNERSKQQIGCQIENIFQKYSVILEEKDLECHQMIQEIEELKFLNERNHIDLDEIKKMKIELQLKVDQTETLAHQIENLRKICDKLEEEKKNSVFRQEVLRIQMENLARKSSPQLRSCIQNILSSQTASTYSKFSFY